MRKYHRTVTGYVQQLLARGFALEALVEPQPAREMLDAVPGMADELRRLDLKNVRAENGRVHCDGGPADIPRLNINLRCGARVLVELASFPAPDFEALFQGVAAIPWEDCIPRDGEFPVKGYSISSQLHSVPACQAIVKKAAAKRNSRYTVALEELETCFADSKTVETEIEAREFARIFGAFLDTLSPENRVIFLRRYWFADGYREIAALVGLSEKAVSVRLTRIRGKMRRYLQEREVFL